MDVTTIITTTITAVASIVIALSNMWLNSQRKTDKEEARQMAERNSAKNSIQNMITQDIIRAELLKKTPENYQAIAKEFDKYSENGGNSYIKEKVEDYRIWYEKRSADE